MNVTNDTVYTLPTATEFRQAIETQIWSDMVAFVITALGISLVIFFISKLAG